MESLIAFLPQALPEQSRTSIVHGDYRLDNCMMHADEPRVVAVLDWELSTLGDPLADFSYFLMSWVMSADGGSSLGGLDLPALSIPSMEEAAARYCELTGRDTLPPLDWLFAYNLFRLSAICQGIAGRVRDGTAASAEAARKAALARPLAEAAWESARKAGA
jgi:aminoglycoside phosphotransferase (APT) family kinase protein